MFTRTSLAIAATLAVSLSQFACAGQGTSTRTEAAAQTAPPTPVVDDPPSVTEHFAFLTHRDLPSLFSDPAATFRRGEDTERWAPTDAPFAAGALVKVHVTTFTRVSDQRTDVDADGHSRADQADLNSNIDDVNRTFTVFAQNKEIDESGAATGPRGWIEDAKARIVAAFNGGDIYLVQLPRIAERPLAPSTLAGHTYVAKVRVRNPLPTCREAVLAQIRFTSETSADVIAQKCDDYRPVPGGDEEDGPFQSYGTIEEKSATTRYRISYSTFFDRGGRLYGVNTLVLDDFFLADPTITVKDGGISLYENEMTLVP
jgi:hypothetical protein